jgi:DNA-binding MarR family transcriptional regulator
LYNYLYSRMPTLNFIDSHPLRTAFLANTLDALAAQIVEHGEELLREAGIGFPARASSTVLLLGERTEMSAADIAKALRQPHQLVTQRIELLIDLGIVARIDDPRDARRKMLRLTGKGRRQFVLLNRVLEKAQAAFDDLFREIGCDLSAKAQQAVAALNRSALLSRARFTEA